MRALISLGMSASLSPNTTKAAIGGESFNREVTLMPMGFPLDYWEEYLDNAICSFGRVLSWENDPDRKTRLIIKARVADLESIPQFIVFSESEGFEGDS